MAGNLQNYTLCHVHVDGALLTQASSISIARKSGNQPVHTIVEGFAGMSPGSAMMEVSIESAVPSADFELNPGLGLVQMRVYEFMFFSAGRTLTAKGYITDDNFTAAVDSPSKLSLTVVAQWADWE